GHRGRLGRAGGPHPPLADPVPLPTVRGRPHPPRRDRERQAPRRHPRRRARHRRGGDDHPGRRRDGQGPRRGRASLTTFRGPPLDDEPGIGALTLGGLLVETCARHGGREALVFHAAGGVVRWTYDDLLLEVRTTARALL